MKEKKNGFTMIEIVIVVGIIGLLAALGGLMVTRAVHNGRVKTAESELEMIATAVLQLAWDTGRFPNGALRNRPGSTEIVDLSTSSAGLLSIKSSSVYDDWKGPYYTGSFVDPWGNNYFFDPDYRIDGKFRIVVGSFGAKGHGLNKYAADDIYILLDD